MAIICYSSPRKPSQGHPRAARQRATAPAKPVALGFKQPVPRALPLCSPLRCSEACCVQDMSTYNSALSDDPLLGGSQQTISHCLGASSVRGAEAQGARSRQGLGQTCCTLKALSGYSQGSAPASLTYSYVNTYYTAFGTLGSTVRGEN